MNEQTAIVHNCAMCAFSESLEMATPDGKPVIGQRQLVCKRNPPQLIAIPQPTPGGMSVQMMAQFPPVSEAMYCYSFEPENGAQDVT